MIVKARLTIALKNYVADPFWPTERDLKSVERLVAYGSTVEAALTSLGLTVEWFQDAKANRLKQWHLADGGRIYIPSAYLGAMLKSDKRAKNFKLDSISDFTTDRDFADGTVIVQRKSGEERVVEFIGKSLHGDGREVLAYGDIELAAENVSELSARLVNGLQRRGLGSCRHLGFGRGRVIGSQVTF